MMLSVVAMGVGFFVGKSDGWSALRDPSIDASASSNGWVRFALPDPTHED